MSETKDTENTEETSPATKTMSLRKAMESSHVRQNFSHGRSRSVLVEKKRKRTISTSEKKPEGIIAKTRVKTATVVETPKPEPTEDESAQRSGMVLRTLTEQEKDARAQALADSRVLEAEERKLAEIESERRVSEEEADKLEREAAEQRQTEEEARGATEEAGRVEAEQDAGRQVKTKPEAGGQAEAKKAETDGRRKKTRHDDQKTGPGRRAETPRRRGKLTIANALDDSPRQRSLASIKRQREREKKQSVISSEQKGKISREVIIPETITVQELANRMAERAFDIVKFLMKEGHTIKIDDEIDVDTAQLVVEEFGHIAKRVSEADVEEGLSGEVDRPEDLKPRSPVVAVMGHVDHGKTSLLDAIRKTNVTASEAGGITQHIGAYQVTLEGDQKVTFLDTPGHEAFTAMRARGAEATDIVVLVVAADDGVMPQTVEAINHAKAAGVPLVVAINKIDRPDADPARVRNELLQHEVILESMSGDVLEVEVSAKEVTNLDKLLEIILLQAEILELKANPSRPADGVIVEARLERGRGPVGTGLIQRGTLKIGDIIVAGAQWGKVRALVNDQGDKVDEAIPSVPVEILGLNGAPEAGDSFTVVASEARAREIAAYRQRKRRDALSAGTGARASLEHMMDQLKEAGIQEFPIVVKADAQGSAEAITHAVEKLGNEEVRARVIHAGAGGITESDISLASASNAVVLGFNVRANTQAREAAERSSIEIRYYNVIYDLADDVKSAMSGMLAPTLREEFLGNAEVLEVFDVSKIGKVAGCRVTEGTVTRGAHVRLIRDNVVIHEGTLSTLKRFKDEAKEVNAGQECGMAFENHQDLKPGDVIECFNVESVSRTL